LEKRNDLGEEGGREEGKKEKPYWISVKGIPIS